MGFDLFYHFFLPEVKNGKICLTAMAYAVRVTGRFGRESFRP